MPKLIRKICNIMKKLYSLALILFISNFAFTQKTTATNISFGNFFTILFGGQLNWGNNNTWNNGVPADGDTVIINLPTRYNINQITTVGELEVNSSLQINNNRTLKTHQLILNNAININGNFVLQADDIGQGRILEVGNNGAINGTFTSQYWFDRCNNWSLYGSPFDVTFNELADSTNGNMVYTGFPDSDYPTFNYVNAYFVDEDWFNGFDGYVVPNSANQTIPRGSGIWYWNSDTTYNSTNPNNSIPQEWKISTSGSLDFSQTFNFDVTYTDHGFPSYDGWNLLSNPYPATINWDAAGWSMVSLSGEIHYFNTCSQNFSSYVGGVSVNGGSPLVSPYQGFYVKANASFPSLSCTREVIAEDFVQLRSEIDNILKIKYLGDEIAVRLHPDADENFNNHLDANKFFNNSYLYSKSDTSLSENYAINSTFNADTVVVPVYLKESDTLWFEDILTFAEYSVYLDDLNNETSTNGENNFTDRSNSWYPLNSNNNYYVIEDAEEDFKHTVNIVFIKNPVQDFSSVKEFEDVNYSLQTFDNYFILSINQNINNPLNVEVYDMTGRIVQNGVLQNKSSQLKIDRTQQVYLIRLTNRQIQTSIKAF